MINQIMHKHSNIKDGTYYNSDIVLNEKERVETKKLSSMNKDNDIAVRGTSSSSPSSSSSPWTQSTVTHMSLSLFLLSSIHILF